MWTSNSGENASKAFARESRSGKGHAGKTCAREREACEREKRTWSNEGGDRGRGYPGGGASGPSALVCRVCIYVIYMYFYTRDFIRTSLPTCMRACVKGPWLSSTRARSLSRRCEPHGALSDVYKRTFVRLTACSASNEPEKERMMGERIENTRLSLVSLYYLRSRQRLFSLLIDDRS